MILTTLVNWILGAAVIYVIYLIIRFCHELDRTKKELAKYQLKSEVSDAEKDVNSKSLDELVNESNEAIRARRDKGE